MSPASLEQTGQPLMATLACYLLVLIGTVKRIRSPLDHGLTGLLEAAGLCRLLASSD